MRLILFLIPLSLFAQSGDLCSVEGQLVNSATGEPVRRGNLVLARVDGQSGNRASYSAISDASGKFTLSGVTPGKYRLGFTRNGFVPTSYTAEGSPRSASIFTLDRAQKLTGIVFRVTPDGAVSGRVVDENGDPVPYVQVTLGRYQYMQGRKQLVPAGGSASTNDLGEYRVFNVSPGKYYLWANYNQGMIPQLAAEQQDEEAYVTTYYPGGTDPAAAAPIQLGPGAQIQSMNIRLAKVRTVRVKGRVSQNTGVSVMLFPRNMTVLGARTQGAVLDRQGNFEIAGVMPGSYLLAGTVNGPRPYGIRQPLEVGPANVEGINLSIPPPAEATGKIRAEGDNAELPQNLRVTLTLRDTSYMIGPLPNSKVNEDGSFKLENISLDRYNVTVNGLPPGWYVKAVRAGGIDALASGLDASGGAPGNLEIVLSPNAGEISGVVQDEKTGQASPGATVALVPQENDRRGRDIYYRSARSDETGRFTLRNVIPGEYKVFAFEQVESGAYMDPEFIRPLESKGEPVKVREGDKPNIQVKLIPQ